MRRRLRVSRLSTIVLVLGVLLTAGTLSGSGVAVADHNFSDVPNSAFYHDFVDFLVQHGITSGCSATPPLYCGGDPVTRGQIAVFLEKLATALDSCPPDAVKVGPTCIDKYEASVWETAGNAELVEKIRAGTVTLTDLLTGGAIQRGATSNDYGAACPVTGHGCMNLYAVSIPGVLPSRSISWFQAVAAARNAGKRLPNNAEWQAAAFGTPDSFVLGPCNDASAGARNTGSEAGCISDAGAFDMVGNVWEWVDEWVPRSTCGGSWGAFAIDLQCLVGADAAGAALQRGGSFIDTASAGVFAVQGSFSPAVAGDTFGFRAAR